MSWSSWRRLPANYIPSKVCHGQGFQDIICADDQNKWTEEPGLGRVIHTENSGRERLKLQRSVILALRELMRQQQADQQTQDLAAYISLALAEISESVETSVAAWEKRDYWIKADRFRMEWAWAEKLSRAMRVALLADNWREVALIAGQVGAKLNNVEVPQRHKIGTPWIGAWEKLKTQAAKS